MILAGVDLPDDPTHAWSIVSNDNEQILDDETCRRQFVDDFDVRESLLVGADFILALDDVDAFRPQCPVRLARAGEIQVQDGFVIFL